MILENRRFDTLTDLLEFRANRDSEKFAFGFFEDGETETERLSYGQLYSKAAALAAHLAASNFSGQPVLLIQNSGLEYLVSFFAVSLAGGIPVPAYPPRNNRNSQRIQTIIEDTGAELILTTRTVRMNLELLLEDLKKRARLRLLAVDDFLAEREIPAGFGFRSRAPEIGFLQYTSGSTGAPKGVVVTQRNLIANLDYIWRERLSLVDRPKMVSWLPLFHDMGLIGGIFTPLWGGFPGYLMPPGAFLQKPFRWLKLISDQAGSISPAPNFAYELCAEKIDAEKRRSLDLSSWQMVLNGSEKVRPETLERFAETFADCGFQKNAFAPCYGLAEATLMVSSVARADAPAHVFVKREALAAGRVEIGETADQSVPIVSCGKPLAKLEVLIVDPATAVPCANTEIGEIWVRGASVASAYWQKSEESRKTFANRPAGIADTDYMRTGDLGFLLNGELYITGRIKNLVIIGGQNYYAQDLEKCVEYSSIFFRKSGTAAFSVERDNGENLVIVAEVERGYWNRWKKAPSAGDESLKEGELRPRDLAKLVRRAISEEFAIPVADLVFIKPGRLPKTSSGKTQHRICKESYLEGAFDDCSLKIF